jgi:uncharacterized protein
MTTSRTLLGSILITSLLLQSCTDDEKNISRLSVVGEALVDLSPDTAVIVVSVVTQHPQALAAQQANARITSRIDSALTKTFGAKAVLKSRGYSLQPQMRYNAKSIPSIIGYEARNSVEIALGDLARVGEAVDVATAAGANSVESVGFELRNVDSAHARSLADASKRAVAKAESMATAVGSRVVRVIDIVEVDFDAPMPPPYASMDAQRNSTEAAAVTPIRPGSIRHRSGVRLIAEIEPAK